MEGRHGKDAFYHAYDGSKSTNSSKQKSEASNSEKSRQGVLSVGATPPGFANLNRFDSYLRRSQGSSEPKLNAQPHVSHVSRNLKLKTKGFTNILNRRNKRFGLPGAAAWNPVSSRQTMSSSADFKPGIVINLRKTMEQRRCQNEDGVKEEKASPPLQQEHKSLMSLKIEGRANSDQHQDPRVFVRDDNKFPATALIKREITSQMRHTTKKPIAHENKICPTSDGTDNSDDDCKAVLVLPPRKITRSVQQTVTSDIQIKIKMEPVETEEKQEESLKSSSMLLKGGTDKSYSPNKDPFLLSKLNHTNTSCGEGTGATQGSSSKSSSPSKPMDGSRNTCHQKNMKSLMIKECARPPKKLSGLLPTPIQRPAPGGNGEWRTYAQAKRSDESSKSAFQKGTRNGQDFTKNIRKQNADDKHQGSLPIKAATATVKGLTFAEMQYADMITVKDVNFGFRTVVDAEIFAESQSLGSYRGTASKWGNMLMPVLPRLKPPPCAIVKLN